MTQQPAPRVEYHEVSDTLIIEGVRWSGALLRTFSAPSPDCLYRITRRGESVMLEEFGGWRLWLLELLGRRVR